MNLEWLYSNLTTVVIVLGLTTLILFLFPIFLGKDLINKSKDKKQMTSLYIGIGMAFIFLVICLMQIFHLQKEVRKLNNITSHLLKMIKNKNGSDK